MANIGKLYFYTRFFKIDPLDDDPPLEPIDESLCTNPAQVKHFHAD